jgi:hypothetical protein
MFNLKSCSANTLFARKQESLVPAAAEPDKT